MCSNSWKSDLARYQGLQQQVSSLEKQAEENRLQNRQLMSTYSQKLKSESRNAGAAIDLVMGFIE